MTIGMQTHIHLFIKVCWIVDCGNNALRNARFRCFIVPFDVSFNISNINVDEPWKLELRRITGGEWKCSALVLQFFNRIFFVIIRGITDTQCRFVKCRDRHRMTKVYHYYLKQIKMRSYKRNNENTICRARKTENCGSMQPRITEHQDSWHNNVYWKGADQFSISVQLLHQIMLDVRIFTIGKNGYF